jgi:ADP-ribose pyrophosphatase
MVMKHSKTDRKTIYQGRVVNLHLDNDYWEIVEHKPAVAILAVQDQKMLLVKQYRAPLEAFTLEIPAGLIEVGEDILEAAAREFAEECMMAGDLSLVSSFFVSPGFCDELVHLIRAENLRPAYGIPDDDEEIELELMSPRELLQGAKNGRFKVSAPAIAAAYLLISEGL